LLKLLRSTKTTNCLFSDVNNLLSARAKPVESTLIKCTLFNAHSIVNKLRELHNIYSCAFDVICITETWLNKYNISDGLIDPQSSFRVVRCDKLNSRGGNVCILVSKRLDTVVITVTNYYASLKILCVNVYVWVERKFPPSKCFSLN